MRDAKAKKANQKQRTEPIHVLLRLPATVTVGALKVNVVDAHNAVVEKHGRVALGKFGQPVAPHLESKLSKQIAEGYETRLYLVSKQGKEFISYSAPIFRILTNKDFAGAPFAHPNYYQDPPSSWLILSEKLSRANLANLELASNSRKVLEVLAEARTPFMAIKKSSL